MSYFTLKMNDDYMPHSSFDAEIKQFLYQASQDPHDALSVVEREISLYPQYQLFWKQLLLLS